MIGPMKLYKAVRAVVRVTLDPKNLDDIFVLADLSEESARVQEMVDELKRDRTSRT